MTAPHPAPHTTEPAAPAALDITVVDPMLIAGASATGHGADTDVLTGPDGLPFIPRSRVTARLRDACLQVVAAFDDLLPAGARLLGMPGSIGEDRILTVGDAHLPVTVRAAVAATRQQLPAGSVQDAALVAAITAAVTVVDVNMAVDRDGSPRRGALRTTRMVQPGLTFTAPLRWTRAPAVDELHLLARSVLVLRQLGGGETDGLGRVDVILDGNRDQTLTMTGISVPGAAQ